MTKTPPGRWLEQELKDRGLGPRDIARVADVSTQAVYKWFTGKAKPTEHVADIVADLLNIPALEVRYRFELDIPRWAVERAQWQREVKRYRELVSEEEQVPRS